MSPTSNNQTPGSTYQEDIVMTGMDDHPPTYSSTFTMDPQDVEDTPMSGMDDFHASQAPAASSTSAAQKSSTGSSKTGSGSVASQTQSTKPSSSRGRTQHRSKSG
nr:uncharacterized protein CI109_005363 [Kwoniella shandongensis]KAA5526239.1 hypothetical protein CI109_005363 [Kwoniella shandongensis]